MRGAEAPGAHLPRDGEGGRGSPTGPARPRGNIPLAEGDRLGPSGFTLSLPLGTPSGKSQELLQPGKLAPPKGPGEAEPGLSEGDVGRGLFLQVPQAEVAAPAPFRGLRHGRAQAVHVVTSVAVITEQQLVVIL